MAAETDLYTALSGDSSIEAVVENRIYADIRDQNEKIPAIYFARSSTEFTHTLDSYVSKGEKVVFDVICFQTTKELVEALTALVITATAASKFLCINKEPEFDEETDTYYTTIQLSYFYT